MPDSVLSRILRFPVTRIIFAIAFTLAPVAIVQIPMQKWHLDKTWLGLPFAVLAALGAYAGYRLYVRVIERRAPAELSTPGALGELAGGVALGVLLFSATIGILAAVGAYKVSGTNSLAVLKLPLAVAIVSGVFEELMFRAILFRITEESLGSWLALGVSACLFGLVHLANPGHNVVGALSIIIEAGILLAGAYMFTRRLWICIGLHFAWNFTEAGIFGTDVSGRHIGGLLQSTLTGPAWLTGGAFGPEASVVAILLCLVAGVAFIVASVRRGHVVPPFWRRGTSEGAVGLAQE